MYKKTILAGLLTIGCTGPTWGIPARPGARTVVRTDGATLTLHPVGDERFHSFVTEDGLCVDRGADGVFYYRKPEGLTDIKAHDPAWRDAQEEQYVATTRGRLLFRTVAEETGVDKGLRKAPARVVASQVASSGSPRIPVLLLEYRDKKFRDGDPAATFRGFFNDGEKSALRYFTDQSNGLYTPQFDIYGPFSLPRDRASYGGNNSYGQDKGVGRMVADGAKGLDADIDFSLYDNDGDGECDVLIVLYAGDGEASSNDPDASDSVWPCQWSLGQSDYGSPLRLDGTLVDRFAVFNELNGSDLTRIDGVGTFCHEFSHCLGLPDFYDTDYNGHFGMGSWSLMDFGSYNDDTYTPAGYSAYEKEYMGWISIEEGETNTLYTLPPMNSGSAETDRAVRLTNPADMNEYFILENRRLSGWDEHMPAEGLMISHVTYDAAAWNANRVNTGSLQRMTPVPADNDLKMDRYVIQGVSMSKVNEEDQKGDLWPYGGNDAFTDTSAPAALTNSGGTLGRPVTDIHSNEDGTVSFWVSRGMLPQVDAPIGLSYELLSPERSVISWECPGSDDVSFTVEVQGHSANVLSEVVEGRFDDEGHGWRTEGFTTLDQDALAGTVARLGSAQETGSVTSPIFIGAGNGCVTVSANARSYGGDAGSLAVMIVDETGTQVDSRVVELSTAFEDHVVVFDSLPECKLAVKLASLEKKKRVLLSCVDVFTGNALEKEDEPVLLEGVATNSLTVERPAGESKCRVRVKTVPADKESLRESEWSDCMLLDFSLYGAGTSATRTEFTGSVEYYGMDGVRVGTPMRPGLYIARQGTHTTKIVVR